ncbi:MAG: leucine--tRNA ligase, partial [Patescibacteria group bacterium]|nr:leucine--tRNA ligase [Patescibacteria group bacterium]
MSYDHKKIEQKWQATWDKNKDYMAQDFSDKPKMYYLIEFPYPSGDGLHVGHVRSYTAFDALTRKRRMQGFNVLYPIGWDAFGLPTENYALKTGVHPSEVTKKNVDNFRRQLKSLGLSFDWSREVNTTDPKYYKWTQWIFLKLFEHGLAYQAKMPINWCPSCKIGLANEEVVDGRCERCKTGTERREIKQWVLKITKYADRLIDDLENINFLPKINAQQINWIGKSFGTNIHLPVVGVNDVVKVFTTRVDTIFGVTAIILAPEHELILKLRDKIKNWPEVEKYLDAARRKSDLERTDLSKIKTGVELKGIKVINPINQKEIPVWVGDYVIATYGGGAVIMVAAHDERDFAFAQKYGLPILEVVKSTKKDAERGPNKELLEAFCSDGVLVNSDQFNGLTSEEARKQITEWLIKNKASDWQINYKLRDWIFSRQHYWGEPIPLVYCEKCACVKPKILLTHGIYGHSRENWFPWFKREMEGRGHEVLIPDLPNNEHPTLEEWLEALKKLDIQDNDRLIVVGHSLGAVLACQFILKRDVSVEKLILVGPTGVSQGEKNWKNLLAAGCDEESLECIKKFNTANKNLDKIKKLVKESIIYLSDNDPYIPLEVKDDYRELDAKVKIFNSKGHFNEAVGILELPESLQEFPEDSNAGWVPIPEKDSPVELPKKEK